MPLGKKETQEAKMRVKIWILAFLKGSTQHSSIGTSKYWELGTPQVVLEGFFVCEKSKIQIS